MRAPAWPGDSGRPLLPVLPAHGEDVELVPSLGVFVGIVRPRARFSPIPKANSDNRISAARPAHQAVRTGRRATATQHSAAGSRTPNQRAGAGGRPKSTRARREPSRSKNFAAPATAKTALSSSLAASSKVCIIWVSPGDRKHTELCPPPQRKPGITRRACNRCRYSNPRWARSRGRYRLPAGRGLGRKDGARTDGSWD